MTRIEDLQIKIFADGADWDGIRHYAALPYIKGFTTNPTLMRTAGITDYKTYAKRVIELVPDRPLSFEVTADDFDSMERQAREIATWGSNVYVKIPITNTRRETSCPLVRKLSLDGIPLNVTAMMTLEQVRTVGEAVRGGASTFVSVFAGRVADTGRDPVPHMAAAVEILRPTPNAELLWASPRELLNIFQADAVGCHIITVTHDVLKKLALVGKDLGDYSLETVQMFYNDAKKIGYA